MKKPLLVGLLSTLVIPIALAQDLEGIEKDLAIMKNIFITAMKQNSGRSEPGHRSIEGYYLANQGIVFQVDTHFPHREVWAFSTQDLDIDIEIPPIPPIPSLEFMEEGGITEIELSDINNIVSQFEEQWRESHEMRRQQREFGREMRELGRQMRDLEFELTQADKERKNAIEKSMNALSEQQKQLEKALKENAKKLEVIDAKKQKLSEEKRVAREEMVAKFVQDFESTVGDVLCRYGGGLKSLPKDEYVSFILKGMAEKVSDKKPGSRDKVYVFSKKAISDCVEDKIKPPKFVNEATSYVF